LVALPVITYAPNPISFARREADSISVGAAADALKRWPADCDGASSIRGAQ
jgi:hypothetical protein